MMCQGNNTLFSKAAVKPAPSYTHKPIKKATNQLKMVSSLLSAGH